ncbi:MAG TPA: hypothetical protein VMB18_11190 [Terriglobales bacterium]|nr:hypothetical protein [Terriglobales bacterium]
MIVATDKSGALSPSLGSRVEIVSIPCHFHASKYDQLEQLFLPLLSGAQQASDLMGVRARGDRSALEAAAYMAGELLRDRSFAPVRSLSSGAANLYLLDFVANSFQVDTTVFSSGAGNEALFRVRIKGNIRGDKFEVSDPSTNHLLFSFGKAEADRANFFSHDFPSLAHESRKELTAASERRNTAAEVIDLVLGIPVSGTVLTVRVQKANSSVEVKPLTGNSTLMRLPISAMNNIAKLSETIGHYLGSNATARRSLENAGPAQPDGEVAVAGAHSGPSDHA